MECRLYSDISSESESEINLGDICDELEIIECGLCHEVISNSCLNVINNKNEYYLVKEKDGKVFRLYENGTEKFLLSARKEKDTYYISQYENIPKDVIENKHWCAVLKKDINGNFNLYNNGCEHCDDRLNKYYCSNFEEERQCLLNLHQYDRNIKEANVVAKQIRVDLPLLDSKNIRDSWCPRCPKQSSNKTYSKLPRWNKDFNSLSLPFPGGRVKASSSKNFVLEDGQNELMMVFGKCGHQKFALDIYNTLCPLQAFGIALSMFSWSA